MLSSSCRFPSGRTIESLRLIMLKSLDMPLVDPGPLDPAPAVDPAPAAVCEGVGLLDFVLDPMTFRSTSSGVGKPVDAKLPRRSGSARVP